MSQQYLLLQIEKKINRLKLCGLFYIDRKENSQNLSESKKVISNVTWHCLSRVLGNQAKSSHPAGYLWRKPLAPRLANHKPPNRTDSSNCLHAVDWRWIRQPVVKTLLDRGQLHVAAWRWNRRQTGKPRLDRVQLNAVAWQWNRRRAGKEQLHRGLRALRVLHAFPRMHGWPRPNRSTDRYLRGSARALPHHWMQTKTRRRHIQVAAWHSSRLWVRSSPCLPASTAARVTTASSERQWAPATARLSRTPPEECLR